MTAQYEKVCYDLWLTIQCLCVVVTKAQQLLQGLQATGDEGQQLTAVIEMCQVSCSPST